MRMWDRENSDLRQDEWRERQDRYQGDVVYEVWRRGGNPDNVDYDRVRDHYYDGYSVEASARKMMPKRRECDEE